MIESKTPQETRILQLDDTGCTLILQANQTHKREFAYADISGIFMSGHPLLCWQVGSNVYCIPLKKDSDSQAVALEFFIYHVKAAQGAA
jgi:hypothetical protein